MLCLYCFFYATSIFCTFWSNSTVLSSDSSGEKHPQPDMGKLEEECESADPGSKGAMAPPPPPSRGIAVDTSTASVPGDNLVTIVSVPPLASAEHVSYFVLCFLLSGARKCSRWE